MDMTETNYERLGNVVMLRPPVYLNPSGQNVGPFGIGGIALSFPTIPTHCPRADPAIWVGRFTETCFQIPKAFGQRASIDIDGDGILEYGA